MQKKIGLLLMIMGLVVLAACNQDKEIKNTDTDELPALEVDFEVPEATDVNETVPLKAIVTYGDEKVKDADDVVFEFWEVGKEDDSTKLDAKNNGDGTYTAETTFDHDGAFEMYAHVTARDLHTMPKKSITVGEGVSEEDEHAHEDGEGHEHAHTDGFDMHFMEPEKVKVDKATELMVHLQMDEESFEGAEVRYEIWNDDVSDKHDWVDTKESKPGEYTASHTFAEPGTYSIQIHVTDDNGLHEHEEHEIEVTK